MVQTWVFFLPPKPLAELERASEMAAVENGGGVLLDLKLEFRLKVKRD